MLRYEVSGQRSQLPTSLGGIKVHSHPLSLRPLGTWHLHFLKTWKSLPLIGEFQSSWLQSRGCVLEAGICFRSLMTMGASKQDWFPFSSPLASCPLSLSHPSTSSFLLPPSLCVLPSYSSYPIPLDYEHSASLGESSLHP